MLKIRSLELLIIIVSAVISYIVINNFISDHNSFIKVNNSEELSDEQWLNDLDSLLHYLVKTHPNPYWKTPKGEIHKNYFTLKNKIPELSENEIITGFSRIVSLVGDWHTQFIGNNLSKSYFPVRIEKLSDGYFITSISEKYKILFGKRVIRIGKYITEKTFNMMSEVTSYDNEYSRMYYSPRSMIMSSLLDGLGIINNSDFLPIEIQDRNDDIKTILIKAEPYPFPDDPYFLWFWKFNSVPADDYININSLLKDSPPLYLKNFDEPYWIEYLKEYKTIYFGFNSCENAEDKPFADFIKLLFSVIDNEKPDKLIIDLRNNLGGTDSYLQPLIDGIKKRNEINGTGHLYILTSKKTLSAALHAATWIEKVAQPIFVGEPTGAGPNHFADPELYTLPNSKLQLLVSSKYWQNSFKNDIRQWIEPHIKIDLDSKEYFSGRDEALQRILDLKIE